MQFNDITPDTLTAILISCLDDQSNWVEPLNQFKSFLTQIRSNNPPQLSPPNENFTNEFVFSCMPRVVAKILDNPLTPDEPAVSFLEEVLATLATLISNSGKLQGISMLELIFDISGTFYIHNGRDEMHQYSIHLTKLAESCVKDDIPNILLTIIEKSNNSISIQDYYEISDFYKKISLLIDQNKIFPNKDRVSGILFPPLERFALESDEREIQYSQITALLQNLIEFCRCEALGDLMNQIMLRFLDIDIAGLKISGIKIAVILYTEYYTYTTQTEIESAQSTLEFILSQVSNFEGLKLLEPIFTTFANRDIFCDNLVDSLWNIVSNMPQSVYKKSIELFSNIAVKIKNTQKIVNIAILQPINIDFVTELAERAQYKESITKALFDLAENKKDVNSLEALIKISKNSDLSTNLPEILSNINCPDLLENHIILIDSILTKSPQPLDPIPIFSSISNNISTFSKDKAIDVLKNSASILHITKAKISPEILKNLLSNSKSNELQVIIMKELFPPNAILVEINKDNIQIIIDIVKSSTAQEDLFEIISHLYLTALIQNDELKDFVFKCLWNILLNPQSEVKRRHVSSILLTITDYSNLASQIKSFVNSCLHELETAENKNAAIFISECLHFINGFCTLSSLGVEPHRYQDPEDMIPLNIQIGDNIEDLLADSHLTISELTALVSQHFNKDVMSFALYIDGEKLPDELILGEIPEVQSSIFQIRKKEPYKNLAKITLDNHPVSLFRDEKIEKRLFELLKSHISEEIYDVLIQIPTLDIYTFKSSSQLDSSNTYHFLYDLHYLAKNFSNKFNDNERQEIHNVAQSILISQFQSIVPEARYLLSLLLKQDNANDDLVNVVLFNLCKEASLTKNKEDQSYFLRTFKAIWKIVTDYNIDLSSEVLTAFLFNNNQVIFELALGSKMILNQNFDKVWSIFEKCEDKVKFLEIFTKFDVPKEFYQKVFDGLLPFYNSLNETVLAIYSNICGKWEDFPCKQVSELLINNFIKCTTNRLPKSNYPFNLLYAIMKRSPEVNTEILKDISDTIPIVEDWNYTPMCISEKEMIGLQNLGATCYVNSVVQLVFSIEPIRNFIISTNFDDPSMKAMSNLFTEMLYSKPNYIDMHKFAANWKGFDGMSIRPREQQDANEFLMLLFSRLEAYPKVYSLVSGTQETLFTGEDFNKVQSSPFNTLSLTVMGMNSIHDSMEALKLPEVFDNYKIDDNKSIQVKSYNSITKLPPYLFIQLKRFDYSIETATKIKLNQRYVFDPVIDFKDDLKKTDSTEPSVETRYKLRGVVVHQGEAEQGHYYTYLLAKKENQWYCLNDTHIKPVPESEMKSDGYGRPSGTSGYLLLYERFDVDTSVPKVEVTPNETLINQIKIQNHQLAIENTYFTSYFSKFASNFLDIGNESFIVAMKYYIKALAHSSLKSPFNLFSQKLASLFTTNDPEGNSFLDYFVNYILEDIDIIITIMGYAAPKEIKNSFSDTMKAAFTILPPENDIMVVITAQFDEWYKIVLQNWREGFYFFKILYDFSTIDADHAQFLNDLEVQDGIISFVVSDFKPFVASNSSSFSIDRFQQLCDLTYAFKLFEVLNVKIDLVLAPQFLEWCIGSSKHQEALIHYCNQVCPLCIPQFDKYVDATGRPPSEFLVAELIKFPQFQIPQKWLTNYFSEPADQKHLLRAVHEQFLKDFQIFTLFIQKNPETLCSFFFSPTIEVREETVEKMSSLQEIGPVCELLLPFIGKVVDLSTTLYNNKDYKFTYLPLDCFLGLHFLGFLMSELLTIEDSKLVQFIPIVEKTLHQLVEMKATRDEHTIPIAQIGLILMNKESIPPLSTQFITDIEAVIIKIIPDHKQLSSCIQQLCPGLVSLYKRGNVSADLLIPDNELKNYLFVILFTKEEINIQMPQTKMIKELNLSKKEVINMLKVYTQRYATASRTIKFLYSELVKRINEIEKKNKENNNNNSYFCEIDMKSVYEVLCEFHKDVLDSNINYISSVLLQYLLGEIEEVEELDSNDDENSFVKTIKYLLFIYEKRARLLLETSQAKPKGVMSLIKLASNDRLTKKSRIQVLELITKLLPSVINSIPYVYGDFVVTEHFLAQEVDQYVASVIMNLLPVRSQDSGIIQMKVAQGFIHLIDATSKITDISNTLNALFIQVGKIGIGNIDTFLSQIASSNILLKFWNLKPLPQVKYEGMFEITKAIILNGGVKNYAIQLSEAFKLFANEETFHQTLLEVLNHSLST